MRLKSEAAKFVAGAALLVLAPSAVFCKTVTVSRADLLDKLRGAWVSKAYGVAVGAPTEFRFLGRINPGPVELLDRGLKTVPNQDDLYVNMIFLKVVAEQGLNAPASEFAKAFAYASFRLAHANMQARQNLLAGISPPLSGHPRYSAHAEDIDFQIEADFIGLISPGLPQAAWKLCDRVGHIMNYGDGVYGGVFVAALYEAAFVENDVGKVLESALSAIPRETRYAAIVRDTIQWHKQHPQDWKAAWGELEKKWNRDLCPWGVKNKFNISASLNGAYIALGLLYGNGDLEKTVEIAASAGQDSDCNPATAGGILGTMLGFKKVPRSVRTALAPYMETKFIYTPYTIETAATECLRLAIDNVKANGGKESAAGIQIKVQPFAFKGRTEVAFPTLEAVDMFNPGDSRVVWKGQWSEPEKTRDGPMRYSSNAGNLMEVEFTGTAIYVHGDMSNDHGILEVVVDGKSMGTRDMFLPKTWKWAGQTSAVWLTGLPEGKHTVQVRVTGKKNPESGGTRIGLERIAAYRGQVAK